MYKINYLDKKFTKKFKELDDRYLARTGLMEFRLSYVEDLQKSDHEILMRMHA